MDLPVTDEAIETTTSDLPRIVLNCLLRLLAAALPRGDISPKIAAENEQAAREMFFAMQPRDPGEARAAVRAVAAFFASMDMHARASRPGLADDTVLRLRAGANACSRVCDAAERSLRKPAAAAPKPDPAQSPRSGAAREFVPDPNSFTARRFEPEDCFRPRDRFGQLIPRGDIHLMTKKQKFAAIANPRDPELEAAAIAEEEAMIAEQKALDARRVETACGADGSK
jgi:hypothetical protein